MALTMDRSLVTLTIGPAFLSASIYLTLARIIPIYSSTLSRFKPRTYTILFITSDFIALLLQAAGGAIASLANTNNVEKIGINIMLAGVSWQVFGLGLFAILCAEFAWRVRTAGEGQLTSAVEFVELRRTRRFHLFLGAVGFATLAVFVRSTFRCAELRSGFHGKLAQQEVTFMILEGALIVIAVGLLTFCHPGLVFKGAWQNAGWSLRGRNVEGGKVMAGSGDGSHWSTPNRNEKT
jgi:RTA1 like protein